MFQLDALLWRKQSFWNLQPGHFYHQFFESFMALINFSELMDLSDLVNLLDILDLLDLFDLL